MAKDSTKRKNESPNRTNGKNRNKKAKIDKQVDALPESEESKVEPSLRNNLTVFKYNTNQLFELFVFHGISRHICDMFHGIFFRKLKFFTGMSFIFLN